MREAQSSRARSLAKTVTWRATGTLDTLVLSWLISGSPTIAGAIALSEVATKMVLYFLHERAWAHVSWGTDAGRRRRKGDLREGDEASALDLARQTTS